MTPSAAGKGDDCRITDFTKFRENYDNIFRKPEIGLIGGGFMHAESTTLDKIPKYFKWAKNTILDTTFFIDYSIFDGLNPSVQCSNKIAWIVESREIVPGIIDNIKKHKDSIANTYKFIFTHDKEIESLGDNFIFIPSHETWIDYPDVYEKTKLCSMISSNKGWTPGHKRRLQWVDKFRDKVDLYGRGFNEIKRKEDGLIDYCFSICIENDEYDYYYSEKLLDCFATGTIPIYLGCPSISKFFNMDGIILLDDNFSVENLSFDYYNSKRAAILENLKLATQHNTIEDKLWEKYIKDLWRH